MTNKNRGILLCACREAHVDCDKTCPKGQLLGPMGIYRVSPWRREITPEIIERLRKKQEDYLKED